MCISALSKKSISANGCLKLANKTSVSFPARSAKSLTQQPLSARRPQRRSSKNTVSTAIGTLNFPMHATTQHFMNWTRCLVTTMRGFAILSASCRHRIHRLSCKNRAWNWLNSARWPYRWHRLRMTLSKLFSLQWTRASALVTQAWTK